MYIFEFEHTLDKEDLSNIWQNLMPEISKKAEQQEVTVSHSLGTNEFFSGKEKLQEELFHLFNGLYDNGKQIIFSSDKHPNYIIGLEDRLRSRFSAGMIVDITKPNYESRSALIKTKALQGDIDVSEDVCEFIAHSMEGNIRELEGVLNAIGIQTELRGRKLTVTEVKSLVKNNIKPKKFVFF